MRPEGTARSLALAALLSVERGRRGDRAVDDALRRSALSPSDRRLFTTLVYGVLERQTTLDDLLSRFSARPVPSLDAEARAALRLGLYQLVYLDRVPDHAALNGTVSLLPPRLSGYVNAVLRAYLRFEAALPAGPDGAPAPREGRLEGAEAWIRRFPDLAGDPLRALSTAFSLPYGLVRRLAEAFGAARVPGLAAAFAEQPPVTLRANPLRIEAPALERRLAEAGFAPSPGLYAAEALRTARGDVAAQPFFRSGLAVVQDEASQLAVRALDARPGETVVDACAGPGTKSFGIAMDMRNRGAVLAFDVRESRTRPIAEGARRLGLDIIRPACRDARSPCAELAGRADRALCDVPCSGFGVIAKKPEIRHRSLADAADLPATQAAILEATADCLREGGVLVYSTCTLFDEENGAVVRAFLERRADFEPYDFSFPSRDPSVPHIASEGGMVQLLPDVHRTDGFFIARLRRKGGGSPRTEAP